MVAEDVRTLVIQSRPDHLPATHWLHTCLQSVAAWADACGFDYRCYGDEALAGLPSWYRDKTAGRMPIAFDLVRLQLISQALAGGYQRACWVDADVLLFAPQRLQLAYEDDCAFGREHWVQKQDGRLTVRRNVHNAICAFDRGSVVLPFLEHATLRIMQRVAADRIAPQLVGPKLLGALNSLVGFNLLDTVGAFSPLVVDELLSTPGPAVAALRRASPQPLAGANLCTSLQGARDLMPLCERLLGGLSWPART